MLLAIHSYPGANDAVRRHWPHFKQAAPTIHGIATIGGGCEWPEPVPAVEIGENRYMNGKNLPKRLLDTMEYCLGVGEELFCIAEYDSVFFKPIPKWAGVAAHRAGGRTFGAQSSFFIHNPWFFDRESAACLLAIGRELVETGYVAYGTPESSPDVFLAWCCEAAGLPVKFDLMSEFSRNCLDVPGDLDLARQAYRGGIDIIHGIKTQQEYDYITG